MFEDVVGRLVSGALWGLGAGVLLAISRGGGEGVRDVTRGVMRASLSVADRIQESTAEMREGLEDLAAEVRAERRSSQDGGAE